MVGHPEEAERGPSQNQERGEAPEEVILGRASQEGETERYKQDWPVAQKDHRRVRRRESGSGGQEQHADRDEKRSERNFPETHSGSGITGPRAKQGPSKAARLLRA